MSYSISLIKVLFLLLSNSINSLSLHYFKINKYHNNKLYARSINWIDFMPSINYDFPYPTSDILNISKLIHYEDDDIVVAYKPNTILSQDSKDPTSNDVVLLRELNKLYSSDLYLIHRLDRPCSGLLLFAKTKLIANILTSSMKKNQISKQYLAVINGKMETKDYTKCSYWIEKTNDEKVDLVSVDQYEKFSPSKKLAYVNATLEFKALYSFQPNKQELNSSIPEESSYQSLVKIKLKTGRKHQIRAIFGLGLKYPICGDKKYNAIQSFKSRDIALHAYKLQFIHPTNNTNMTFTCPPPHIWSRRFGRFDDILLIDESI